MKPAREREVPYAWVIVGLAFLALAVSTGLRSTIGLLIRPWEQEFGWDRAAVSLTASFGFLAYGLAQPLAGRWADRYGPRLVFAGSLALLGASTAAVGVIRNLWQAYLAFGIGLMAAVGGASTVPAAVAVARWIKRRTALAVGVVTLPFGFEGTRRARVAEKGVEMLRDRVDALIVVPNDRLLGLGDHNLPFIEAFRLADDVLRQGVQGISDLVTTTGLINVDFADVKAIMAGAGSAMMAIGEGNGDGRALQAAQSAISSPLLETSIDGARGVLMNVTGGPDLTLLEVHEAAQAVRELADEDANIIFGTVLVPNPKPEVKITLIATGVQRGDSRARLPVPPSPALSDVPRGYDRPGEIDLPAFLRRRR